MKANDLAKLLLANPEAEVIFSDYVGVEVFQDVKSATLFKKGSIMNLPVHTLLSNSPAINNFRKCKSDIIYLSRDE